LVLGVVVLLLALIGLGVFIFVRDYRARGYLDEAQQAIKRGDYVEADKHLEQYLKIYKSNAAVHFLRARTARRAGDYDKAEKYLAEAKKLGWPQDAIQLERLMANAQRGELADEDEQYLWAFTKQDPSHEDVPLILEALTKGYLKDFKLYGARQALERWIELEPDDPAHAQPWVQAHLWRGWVRGNQNDPTGALEDYERAVAVAPDNIEARMRLADLLITVLRRPERALEHYQILHERLPDDPAVLLGLAVCQRERGHAKEAVQLLDEILNDRRFAEIMGTKPAAPLRVPAQLSPETAAWVTQCARYAPLEMRGQPDYILSVYGGALFQRGELAMRANDLARAHDCLERVVELTPYNPQMHTSLALCLQQRGDEDGAKKHRAKAEALREQQKKVRELSDQIMHSRRDPDLRCRLGELLLDMGNEREGMRWLQSALREDAQHERTQQVIEKYQRDKMEQALRPPR
jgi:tetratricopeptide (TPR) repeat protein